MPLQHARQHPTLGASFAQDHADWINGKGLLPLIQLPSFPYTPVLGWSSTRAEIFRTCRRRYFYQYYAKYDREIPMGRILHLKTLSSIPMTIGTVGLEGPRRPYPISLEPMLTPYPSDQKKRDSFRVFCDELNERIAARQAHQASIKTAEAKTAEDNAALPQRNAHIKVDELADPDELAQLEHEIRMAEIDDEIHRAQSAALKEQEVLDECNGRDRCWGFSQEHMSAPP